MVSLSKVRQSLWAKAIHGVVRLQAVLSCSRSASEIVSPSEYRTNAKRGVIRSKAMVS
jgi:hypothetical protein